MPFEYPQTKTIEQVDTYHGTAISDPYRWLEDPDSDDSRAWIDAQNQLTFKFLENIKSRSKIKERVTQLWNYEKYGTPFKRDRRYFYFKNDGLQNQSVLYVLDDLDGEPRVLLDPNTLSEDGTVALNNYAVSEDGKLLAYALSSSGSDWQEWHVRDVETGKDLPDLVKWSKFSGASWTHDSHGFFYSGYDAPNEESQYEDVNYYQKLYYHRIGTPQSEDLLVYDRPDRKEWGFSGFVTDCGRYLIISVWRGTEPKNLIFYRDLQDPESSIEELIPEFEAQYDFVGNDGHIFWFRTDRDASRYRLISIDTVTKQQREILPEGENTLEFVSVLNRQFVVEYLKDACSQIQIFNLEGVLIREVELPEIGSVGGFGGKPEDTETFYSFTGFTTPTTIYRYDMTTGESTVFRQPTVDFNPDDYETQQVFYHSQDGTRVPMFIVHKKGIDRNGNNPTYLYGYGGFNISLTPMFSVGLLVWMELGGVLAIPNLRGGGEYGETWHQAGTKLNKQNVFDDFIAAAEWLIEQRYTASAKLAIGGGSNGGLLVGACMTQRPDLFAAAIPEVGVLDMLRFHKFTIGWAWCSDFGSPDDPEEFKALYAYSPLHNVKSGTAYPATLLITADHDDRVVPAHSFKFAATLQAADAGENPILIRIETKAGHGAGKPTAKRIEEVADKWAFLTQVLEMA
ncbi:prolyl oligopeptidase family serine peptidase [Baaleninema sp.]|uniref:prolyl oligopeptidase family serine peptidase n=1 Tax=Baaleninema sp. TaxID=3101197 RepID=UPI003D025A06